MSIDREDCDERQARLDWMIEEFRQAQTRRLMKGPEKGEESQVESAKKVVVTGPAASQ
jgi:hypothetical protein